MLAYKMLFYKNNFKLFNISSYLHYIEKFKSWKEINNYITYFPNQDIRDPTFKNFFSICIYTRKPNWCLCFGGKVNNVVLNVAPYRKCGLDVIFFAGQH